MDIVCSNCADEGGITRDYPYCSEACELEYLATHGSPPVAFVTIDGRFIGLLVGMGL